VTPPPSGESVSVFCIALIITYPVTIDVHAVCVSTRRVGADDGDRVLDGRCCDVSGYHDNQHSNALHHGNHRTHLLGLRRRTTHCNARHDRRHSSLDGNSTLLNICIGPLYVFPLSFMLYRINSPTVQKYPT